MNVAEKINIKEKIKSFCKGEISDCENKELYYALLLAVKSMAEENPAAEEKKKKLYYVSAEFLTGRLLINNLINLGVYNEVKDFLLRNGKNLDEIAEEEPEPSLGNGGLGRLAACFMDSVATLGLNGDGVGLNYHFGLFRQIFKNNMQNEIPDPWIENISWLKKTDVCFEVNLGGRKVKSVMFDIDVIGYGGGIRKLHLFDIETADESIIKGGIDFDKNNTEKNLTLFLYPDDSNESGRMLRVYQEYFMASSAAQLIVSECEKKGSKLWDLADYAVVQINDTHPAMIIPELIRLLLEKGVSADLAIDAVKKTCAYTNHTILAEALEKWDLDYIKKAAPQTVPVIEMLDSRVRRLYPESSVYIIDGEDRVHMANMAIHFGFSINGVAELHTKILKNNELNNFYKIYPEKFNNKTNGITFRRWLIECNPSLCGLISEYIGEGFKFNAGELEKLSKYSGDKEFLEKLLKIKSENKKALKDYMLSAHKADINENSVFDIQIKRLHEYKRQQLNALYVINKYLEIKSGKIPETPITAIFGAKAAPAYKTAKDIIHLILCLSSLSEEDEEVKKYLRVVMVENYNVSAAERLIPACDISEQISLASKEASGTGNMKFMLNGAVTLGTEDGANVEIHSLVGDDNIYIFGASSDEVIKRYEEKSYNPKNFYEKDKDIKQAVDFITDERLLKFGDKETLSRLQRELLDKDWFMTLPDFSSYKQTKERALSDYKNKTEWAKKMLVNISKAGYFSADRTVEEYNRDIWRL